MKLEDYIASIENYPKERGFTFRDISPLMLMEMLIAMLSVKSFSMRLIRRLT